MSALIDSILTKGSSPGFEHPLFATDVVKWRERWLPTAYRSPPLPPRWGSSFTETPPMLLMLWRVMACVHLHRTVVSASGGLGSAEAWFIDYPVVAAATLTIQSQTNGQVDDDGRVLKVQHAGKFVVVALVRDVLSERPTPETHIKSGFNAKAG